MATILNFINYEIVRSHLEQTGFEIYNLLLTTTPLFFTTDGRTKKMR